MAGKNNMELLSVIAIGPSLFLMKVITVAMNSAAVVDFVVKKCMHGCYKMSQLVLLY